MTDKIVFYEMSRFRRWHNRRDCPVLVEQGAEVLPLSIAEANVRGYARPCVICAPVDTSALKN